MSYSVWFAFVIGIGAVLLVALSGASPEIVVATMFGAWAGLNVVCVIDAFRAARRK